MKTFSEFLSEAQEHTSAGTSLNQVSAGIKHAVKSGLIEPNSMNIDVGGGAYDSGKEHVENSISNAQFHVSDPFNRTPKHNDTVQHIAGGNADYVGLHNVLNVIKEPEERAKALHKVKSFMKPQKGIAHITVYEGDKTGNGRVSKQDKGSGSSWQEHRSSESYMPEVQNVFPDHSYTVTRKGKNILVRQK